MKKPTVIALLFAIITYVHYRVIPTTTIHPVINTLIYLQLSFFIISAPVFWILIPKLKYCRFFIFRILIGVIIGLISTKIMAIFYDGWDLFARNELSYAFIDYIAMTLFQSLVCGSIFPGCLYAEIVYRLLMLRRWVVMVLFAWVAIAFLLKPFLIESIAIDKCLDMSGRWDEAHKVCQYDDENFLD